MRHLHAAPPRRSTPVHLLKERSWRATTRLISVCVVLCALFVTSAVIPTRAQTAVLSTPVPVPNQIQIEQDDHVATLSWNGFPHWGNDNPTGVSGYQIQWGLANGPLDHTNYAMSPVIQLQPLVNGQLYQVVIRAIDAYGHLSAPMAPQSFTGSSARVDALRQQMNGFFDDFNLPEGPVDELKWNMAVSHSNDPAKSGFFINDQFHAHSMLGDLLNDRGQIVSRPRAPLLIAGRTATIVFDLDGAQRRDFWYLDLLPKTLDITGQVNLETGAPGYPGTMVRLRQTGNFVAIFWVDAGGIEHQLASSPDLMTHGIKLIHNVRRHWKVTVSQSLVQVFIDTKLVVSAPVAIPWTVGCVHWMALAYNNPKANEPQCLIHWDNFGFDAPQGWRPSTTVHNYRTVPSDGAEFAGLYRFAPHPTTIAIPDSLQYATSAQLLLTLQMDGFVSYVWNALDAVTLNGAKFAIAQPSGAGLGLPSLVAPTVPYSLAIPVPVSLLKRGLNTLSFAMQQSGVLNVHLEVSFPAGYAPVYTQPSEVASLLGMPMISIPDMGVVGPGVTMTTLGTQPLWPYLEGLVTQEMANVLPVSGVVTLSANVSGDIALGSTGKPCGVSRVEFLVDQQVVSSVPTVADCAAMGGSYSFTVDTTQLSNGRHELFVRAYSAVGTPSIPDYLSSMGTSGEYYPLVINVAN